MNWKLLVENNLNPNQYSILLLLYLEEYNILKDLLKLTWTEDVSLLETDKWIKVVGKESTDIELRSKAYNLFDKKDTTFQKFIDEYIKLFPKGVRSGGKLVRSDRKSIEVKMQRFLQEYSYIPSTILSATKNYVDRKEVNNWGYLRTATYFINKKDEGSDLAAECQNFIDGESNNSSVFTKSI